MKNKKKQVNIKLFFFLIAIILSGTIVIEPVADLKLHAPYFEEDDIVKKNNFFVKTENGYELYMNGTYIGTLDEIPRILILGGNKNEKNDQNFSSNNCYDMYFFRDCVCTRERGGC